MAAGLIFLALLAFVIMLSLMFAHLDRLEDKKSYKIAKEYIEKHAQPVKTVGTRFTSIKEVFDYHLSTAPEGCLWNVDKIIKNGNTYARVALVAPDGEFYSFSIVLSDGSERLSELVAVLKHNIKSTLARYEQHLRQRAAQKDISSKWDGVYNKDVL